MRKTKALFLIYQKMFEALGPRQWWPGETPFEVVIGAILTQNTNWSNVEKAINNLKTAGKLSPVGIYELSVQNWQNLSGLLVFLTSRQNASRHSLIGYFQDMKVTYPRCLIRIYKYFEVNCFL